MVPILVTQGFCNEVPQTGWLKTTEIGYFTVLEARSKNIEAPAGSYFLCRLQRGILPCLFWPLVAARNPRHFFTCKLFSSISASIFTRHFSSVWLPLCPNIPFLIRKPVIGLGPTLHNKNSSQSDYTCKDLISNQGHIYRYWGLGLEHIFLRDTIGFSSPELPCG